MIETGDKEGAEVSIKLSGKYRNFDYYTGNNWNLGTNNATDLTAAGNLIWILDTSGTDAARAYRLDTRQRIPNRDFIFDSAWNIKGLYTDAVVMWVLDISGDPDKVYAYDLFGNRVTGRASNVYPLDFDIHSTDNPNPGLLCGDGTTIWVGEFPTGLTDTKKLIAYRVSDGGRDSTKDITLHANNDHPVGITTDGATIWVADSSDDLIYAYTINNSNGTRNEVEELSVPGAVTLGAIWTDTITFWISDLAAKKVLEYSTGAIIDKFNLPRRAADNISVTKAVTETILNPIKFTVGRDGSTDIYGYDHSGSKSVGSIVLGYNYLPKALYSSDSITYKVAAPKTNASFNIGNNIGNHNSRGIWSDGDTLWVVDDTDNKIYAYDLRGGSRDNDKEFNTLIAAGNTDPKGIWSDGIIMYVADQTANKIFAYDLASKNRVSTKELNGLHSTNSAPYGIWSDGEIMWISDTTADKIFAYELATGTRIESKEFNTLAGDDPTEIWSDGTIMYVADLNDQTIYAYGLNDQQRITTADLKTGFNSANTIFCGFWSNGNSLWISDYTQDRIYIYNYTGNSVKRFVTDATGSDYYLEFQDSINTALQYSTGDYGNQYSEIRAEIINESERNAVDHNYSFALGGTDRGRYNYGLFTKRSGRTKGL